MNIYLLGFMGSGKTTLGKRLAGKLDRKFTDLDAFIEADKQLSIPEIFENYGEAYFRKLENVALQKLSQENNLVVATGGGAPCFHENIKLMNSSGITVYLKIKAGILASRLLQSHTDRPLIAGKSIEELRSYIELKLSEREAFYNQSVLTIEGDNITADDITAQLVIFDQLNKNR